MKAPGSPLALATLALASFGFWRVATPGPCVLAYAGNSDNTQGQDDKTPTPLDERRSEAGRTIVQQTRMVLVAKDDFFTDAPNAMIITVVANVEPRGLVRNANEMMTSIGSVAQQDAVPSAPKLLGVEAVESPSGAADSAPRGNEGKIVPPSAGNTAAVRSDGSPGESPRPAPRATP